VMGDAVTLVSSAEETAKDVYRALVGHGLERDPGQAARHDFLATGDAASFEVLARRFLGPEVSRVRHTSSVAEQFPTGSLARITPEMIGGSAASSS
jgi:glutamate racemase